MLFAKVFLATCLLLCCYGVASADYDKAVDGCGAEYTFQGSSQKVYSSCFTCDEKGSKQVKSEIEKVTGKSIASWDIGPCDEEYAKRQVAQVKADMKALLTPTEESKRKMKALFGTHP